MKHCVTNINLPLISQSKALHRAKIFRFILYYKILKFTNEHLESPKKKPEESSKLT